MYVYQHRGFDRATPKIILAYAEFSWTLFRDCIICSVQELFVIRAIRSYSAFIHSCRGYFLFCGSFKWPNLANNVGNNSQTVLLLDNEQRQCRCSIHYDARYVTEINRISLHISAVHPWPKLKKLSSSNTNTNYLYSFLSIDLFILLNIYYCYFFFKVFWIFKRQNSWGNVIMVLRKLFVLAVANFVTLVKKP